MKYFISLSCAAFLISCGPPKPVDTSSTAKPRQAPQKKESQDGSGVEGHTSEANTDSAAKGPNPPVKSEAKPPSVDMSVCGYSENERHETSQLSLVPYSLTIDVPVLAGLGQKKGVVKYTGSLTVESFPDEFVLTQSGAADSNETLKPVQEELKRLKFAAQSTPLSAEDLFKSASAEKNWQSVYCTMIAASEMVLLGDSRIVLEFSAPIPFGVTSSANAGRMKEELSSKQTWNSITAKVRASESSTVKVGEMFQLKIYSEGIAASTQSGADVAVKLTYDFGGVANNQRLGFPWSIVWHIDSNNHRMSEVRIDSGAGSEKVYKSLSQNP